MLTDYHEIPKNVDEHARGLTALAGPVKPDKLTESDSSSTSSYSPEYKLPFDWALVHIRGTVRVFQSGNFITKLKLGDR